MIWTLLITISVKYCLLVMRADNRGEGGILALMSLVGANSLARGSRVLTAMGLLGAALIYGDGVITPAISVLSALEGVNVVTAAFKPYVMPIARGDPGGAVRRAALRHGEGSAGRSARSCCCGSR
jgi:KUP system potassium uptake protein